MASTFNNGNPLNLKSAPTPGAALAFFAMFVLNLLLFFGRKTALLKSDLLMKSFSDFYQHVSNFSISFMLYILPGFLWVLMGVKFKYVAAMGAVLILANLIYELWIPVLNTKDVIDAYYGIAAVILAFVSLAIIKKYGLKPFQTVA